MWWIVDPLQRKSKQQSAACSRTVNNRDKQINGVGGVKYFWMLVPEWLFRWYNTTRGTGENRETQEQEDGLS